ncbi:hypothetical protein EJ110_NYTH08457 [Nymphaea thermarum]|nr:hypothetical protein EJ110_NYTH08457 [Nymphaea thermarum]
MNSNVPPQPACASNAFIYCVMGYTGCGCFYSYPYRTRLRGQFQLAEAPIGDCLLHCCCTNCALCQEHRELKNRGFDPTAGLQQNALL